MPNSHLQICRAGKLEKRSYGAGERGVIGKRYKWVQTRAPSGEWLVASLYLNSAVEVESQEDAEPATWSLEANGDRI